MFPPWGETEGGGKGYPALNSGGYYRLLAAILAAVLLVSVTGCGKKPEENDDPVPVQGGHLTYGVSQEPVVLNPLLSTDEASAFVMGHIFAGLMRPNEELEMEGYLAQSWEFSDDGLTWTFHLHEDLKWHDGQPFTAADVVFTYETVMDREYTGPHQGDYLDVDRIENDGDHTVRFHLKRPFAPLITRLGLGIIPRHLFEDGAVIDGQIVGTAVKDLWDNRFNYEPVGMGPFRWGAWERGQTLTLSASPDFFLDGPWIQGLTFRFLDEDGLADEMESGGIDYAARIDLDRLAGLESRLTGYVFHRVYGNSYQYVGLDHDHPILGDVKVRRALMYATDRKAIIEDICAGDALAIHSHQIPSSWASTDDLLEYDHDPDRAIALLLEAGYTDIGSDGIRQKPSGERLALTMLSTMESQEAEAVVMALRAQWREVGIDLAPEFHEWNVLLEEYVERGRFEAYLLGWRLGLDPDAYSFFHSSQAAAGEDGYVLGFNDVGFKNDRADWLLEEGRRTTDPGERKVIYEELQQIINEQLPYLFLYQRAGVTAVKSDLKGVVMSPLGPVFPERWYWPE